MVSKLPESLVQTIAARASYYESLQNQQLLNQVSHEQNIMDHRNKINSINQKLDSAVNDSQTLRSSLSNLESAKIVLEQQLAASRSTATASSSQTTILNQRLNSLSEEKQRLLQSINQKSEEVNELTKERESLRKSNIETCKSIINLETQIQQLQSSQLATKIREQNKQQELELLQKNTDWLKSELETKTNDFTKFRNEKIELISRLENDLSNAQSSLQILKNSNETLKSQFSQTSQRLSDTLVKVKELQDAQASTEENFKVEMAAQKRLVELWEKSAKDSKKRVEEVETKLSALHKDETKNVEEWKSKATQEKERADSLEHKISRLEGQLGISSVQSDTHSSENMSKTNGVFSPSAKMIAEIQNGGGSLTQLYTDFQDTKARLERERLKNSALREQMNEIINELESHAPAVLAEREENVRLERELTEISIQLEQSLKTSDSVTRQLRKAEVTSNDHQKETQLLQKQVSDLSRQVQHLLIENKLISDKESPLTADEHTALQKILQGENSPNEVDTDNDISQRLVLFKNVVELEKQNANLLKITRELGLRMEEKEKEKTQQINVAESSAINEANKTIESLRHNIESLNIKIGALERERDMFRQMVSTKPQDKDSIFKPVEEATNEQIKHLVEQNEKLSNNAKELETEFSSFRHEAAETIKSLDKKNTELMTQNTTIQLQLAKTESKLKLSDERQTHAHNNLEILRAENSEFKKRATSLEETITKQDLRIQKLGEDLLFASSASDRIKNENANLKAEKSIWKSIQERLTKDNADLIEQRDRLNNLLASSQSFEAERAASVSEMKDRLYKRIETFEKEVQDLNKKLESQTSELKNVSQKRDTESRSFQSRVDKLTLDLSKANEELSTFKSNYEKLEANYKDVNSQLASANEQIKKFEQIDLTPGSREHVLSQEISALKNSLDTAKDELSLSQKTIEQLRDVSSAAEKQLKEMTTTHDTFKASIDKTIAEKDASIGKLNGQVEFTKKILESTRQNYTQLEKERQEKIKDLETEKNRLQKLVDVLKSNEAKFDTEISKVQNGFSQQAKINSDARLNYEQELVKHAEAANALKSLRQEYLELKNKVSELQKSADSATEKLILSENSWASQKQAYEQEIENLKLRSENISAQNQTLLDQFEKVNTRSNLPQPPSYQEATLIQDAQLRELVSALKREKEIAEARYELNAQESKRLKQKLDQTVTALDTTRVELETLRQSQADQQTLSLQKQLDDKLNDINILKESNSVLRQQGALYSNKAKELEKSIEQLQTKLGPLEGKIAEMNADVKVKEARIKTVQQEANEWKDKAQTILQKYERVDPKAIEELEKTNAKLAQELSDLKTKYDTAVTEVSGSKLTILTTTKELNDTKSRFGKSAKELNDLKTTFETTTQELKTKTEEVTNLNARFEKLKTEFLEKLKKGRSANTVLKEQLAQANSEISRLKTQSTENAVSASDPQLDEIKKELEVTKKDFDLAKTELDSAKKELEAVRLELETEKQNSKSVSATDLSGPQQKTDETIEAELKLVKEQLATKEAELAASKQQPNISDNNKVAEELAEKTKRIQSLEEEINKLSDQIIDFQNQQSDKQVLDLKQANQSLTQQVEELTKAVNENKGSSSLIRISDHETQLSQLRTDLETKATKDLAEEKKKLEEEWRARLTQMQEGAKKKLHEIIAEQKQGFEEELKEKEAELKKIQSKEKAKHANAGNNEDKAVIKKLEEELQSLKQDAAEEKKKAVELTRKEFDMRIRLLRSKADKADAEKAKLQAKLSELEGASATTTGDQQASSQNDNKPKQTQTQQNSKPAELDTSLMPPRFQEFGSNAANFNTPASPNNGTVYPNSHAFAPSVPNAFQFQNNGGFNGMPFPMFPMSGGFQGGFVNNTQANSNLDTASNLMRTDGAGNTSNTFGNHLSGTLSNHAINVVDSNTQTESAGIKRPIDKLGNPNQRDVTNGDSQGNDVKRLKNETD